jgi:hypothetical protein
MELLGISMTEKQMEQMNRAQFKATIKAKARGASYKALMDQRGAKMDGLQYSKLDLQPYLLSKMLSTKQASLLLALRTRTVRGIRSDFGHLFPDKTCPLPGCLDADSLPHVLRCAVLRTEAGVDPTEQTSHMDVFSPDTNIQKEITLVFSRRLETREKLLETPAIEYTPAPGSPALGEEQDRPASCHNAGAVHSFAMCDSVINFTL